MRSVSVLFCLMLLLASAYAQPSSEKPVRVAVVGLVHTHVHWILGREDRGDIELVGIAESNRELAEAYSEQHGYSMDIVYADVEAMLDATKPEAVTLFNTIYDHLEVTRICAERGIHVMVEKPLAVSLEHAEEMKRVADEHGIHLLTNYETTWYGSVHAARDLVQDGVIGDLRKIVVHDGHPGPQEIGVNEEFLEWLTDPVLNGAGALTDFGCYGANLITWLMNSERPLSVTAVTQQIKPEIYPKVDDEATIIVTYPKAQGIIQASWNWPYHRKDMEVYGRTGFVHADNSTDLRIMRSMEEPVEQREAEALAAPHNDPFAYLAGVVRGDIDPSGSLSSLENNMVVMEILDAAKRSAQTGQTIFFE